LALFVIIQAIREGGRKEDWIAKARVATLSSPMSFSHWLRDDWLSVEPAWGARTLGGVYDQLGLAERQPGIWSDDLEFQVGTNIYGAFRQVVEDVTLPGTIVLFAVLGMVCGLAYRRVLEGAVGWLPALAVFYALVLGSYFSNWMAYNSCLFGWVLFTVAIGRFGPHLLRRRSAPDGLAGPAPTHAV
jgi:hypothetical protein